MGSSKSRFIYDARSSIILSASGPSTYITISQGSLSGLSPDTLPPEENSVTRQNSITAATLLDYSTSTPSSIPSSISWNVP
jgi:hypothetical protein